MKGDVFTCTAHPFGSLSMTDEQLEYVFRNMPDGEWDLTSDAIAAASVDATTVFDEEVPEEDVPPPNPDAGGAKSLAVGVSVMLAVLANI